MELKTILNRVYQLPGFVYGKIRLVRAEEDERDRLEALRPRPRPGAVLRLRPAGSGLRPPASSSSCRCWA